MCCNIYPHLFCDVVSLNVFGNDEQQQQQKEIFDLK